MKKFGSTTGGRHLFAEDLLNIQEIMEAVTSMYGDSSKNFVISGCIISGGKMTAGYVWLDGHIRKVAGLDAVGTTVYIAVGPNDSKEYTMQYKDGNTGIWYTEYTATASLSAPSAGVAYIKSTDNEFPRLRQYLETYCVANKGTQTLYGNLTISEFLNTAVLKVNGVNSGEALFHNVDTAVQKNSNNLPTSNAVWNGLDKKMDKRTFGTAADKNAGSGIGEVPVNGKSIAVSVNTPIVADGTGKIAPHAKGALGTSAFTNWVDEVKNVVDLVTSRAVWNALKGYLDKTIGLTTTVTICGVSMRFKWGLLVEVTNAPSNNTVFYSVIVNGNKEHGSVTGSGAYSKGTTVSIAAVANDGYKFKRFENKTNGGYVTANPYSFNINNNMSFEAIFEATGSTPVTPSDPTKFNVLVSTSDSNKGAADGGGQFSAGEIATVTAYPKAGYKFDYWQIGSIKYTDNPYKFNVYANTNVVASFANDVSDPVVGDNAYLIKFKSANTSMGTVNISEDTPKKGAGYVCQATAKDGYVFSKWVDDSTGEVVSQDPNGVLTGTATRNASFTAYFEEKKVTLNFTCMAYQDMGYLSDEDDHAYNRSIQSQPMVVKVGVKYDCYAYVRDADLYKFVHWIDSAGNIITTNSHIEVTATKSEEYTAVFANKLDDYRFMFSTNPEESISQEISKVAAGTTFTKRLYFYGGKTVSGQTTYTQMAAPWSIKVPIRIAKTGNTNELWYSSKNQSDIEIVNAISSTNQVCVQFTKGASYIDIVFKCNNNNNTGSAISYLIATGQSQADSSGGNMWGTQSTTEVTASIVHVTHKTT